MFAKFPRKSFSADTSVPPQHQALWHDAVAKIVKNQQMKVTLVRNLLKKLHILQKSIIFAPVNRKILG